MYRYIPIDLSIISDCPVLLHIGVVAIPQYHSPHYPAHAGCHQYITGMDASTLA